VVGVVCVVLVAVVSGSSLYDVDGGGIYNDLLMQDLYKRLAQLQQQPDYYYDEGAAMQNNWVEPDQISLESRGAAEIRDEEMIEHSSHADGFQYISGGAGEGKQHLDPNGSQENQQEVKTDEHLPFYCHPPNPCPKGFTAEDGCDEFVDDSAEFQRKWIWKMQEKGMCACDEEHMFHCPKDDNTINTEKGTMEKEDLDQVLNTLLGDKTNANNPYAVGDKRHTLVAKKSPIVKRSIADIDAALEKMKAAKRDGNPYLGGGQLHRAAKKGVLHP